MPVKDAEAAAGRIAAAIGEPARARMLFCLLDDRARTGTELALVADISPSMASLHLKQLLASGLVRVAAQGRYRYFSLANANVARVLEALGVLAGGSFKPSTPERLRAARSCYDHLAGALGVALYEKLLERGWVENNDITLAGSKALADFVDVDELYDSRRRVAYPCLDWSERRYHLGGYLAAALFGFLLEHKWLKRERGDRAVSVTTLGARELRERFGIKQVTLGA